MHLDERIAILKEYKEEVSLHKDELATLIAKEMGKPLWEATGEVLAMLNKIDISIEAYDARSGTKILSEGGRVQALRHKPHGVIGVLGPFNFPAHLPNGHIAPALLAGNSVIFKPSELTPKVGEEIVRLWEKTSLPKGALQLLQGGKEVGQQLATHPDISGLFFTGSYRTGVFLSEEFGAHPEKILALEMGGNNPLVVKKISNPTAAAYITIQSAFLTSGQRCTCARRLIVVEGKESASFIEELLRLTRNLRVGPYTDNPEPFMGPVISLQAAENLLQNQNDLLSLGGKALIEMKQLKKGRSLLSPGIIDMTEAKKANDEEFFGPLLQLYRVKDLTSAIKMANDTKYGLAAGILSEERSDFETFFKEIQAGLINWNVPTTGASSSLPFGGVGCSGNHRPSAYYAADYCAYPVASTESEKLSLPKTLTPGIVL